MITRALHGQQWLRWRWCAHSRSALTLWSSFITGSTLFGTSVALCVVHLLVGFHSQSRSLLLGHIRVHNGAHDITLQRAFIWDLGSGGVRIGSGHLDIPTGRATGGHLWSTHVHSCTQKESERETKNINRVYTRYMCSGGCDCKRCRSTQRDGGRLSHCPRWICLSLGHGCLCASQCTIQAVLHSNIATLC